jgi:hypothetical protein
MSRSTGAAAALFVGAAVAMALALIVWAVGVDAPFTLDIALFPLAYLTFAAVGALIVAARPENPIGRLALGAGFGGGMVALADSYAKVIGPLPGQDWAAWIGAVGFPASLGPVLFVVLLFPNGRLASPRWRIVAWTIVVGMVVVGIGNALSPTFADYRDLRNPIGVGALAGSPIEQGGLGWFLVLFGAVAAALGLVPRLRRARGIERQQLKWITFAGAIHSASWVVLALDLGEPVGGIAQYALFATLTLIPAAAGIAILRYRLYEIDVVIRRTLTYTAVVAVLAAVYVGLVVALQSVMADATGGQTVPVALSTLVIAALFGPLRARVRAVVDRRFYRSRYDAQRTLEQFAGGLREQVDLEAVADRLADVAGRAVRPASIGVWVRRPR